MSDNTEALWVVDFDEARFAEDTPQHHSWGSMRHATRAELLAAASFPTDNDVEVAALAFAGLDDWTQMHSRWGFNDAMPNQWRAQARAALEAVKREDR